MIMFFLQEKHQLGIPLSANETSVNLSSGASFLVSFRKLFLLIKYMLFLFIELPLKKLLMRMPTGGINTQTVDERKR